MAAAGNRCARPARLRSPRTTQRAGADHPRAGRNRPAARHRTGRAGIGNLEQRRAPVQPAFCEGSARLTIRCRSGRAQSSAARGVGMQSVEGKIVLVTGAAMGMGRLYAERAIAERAAAVVLWDLDGSALAATRDEIRTPQTAVHAFVVDVSSLSDITTAAARVRAEVGDPDVVVNNARIVR